jgi:hypothetical protein
LFVVPEAPGGLGRTLSLVLIGFLFPHARWHACFMFSTLEKTFPVGKYLVSPMAQRNDTGLFNASVSIRNGAHDRVFRFVPEFVSHDRALVYALAEARTWVDTKRSLA